MRISSDEAAVSALMFAPEVPRTRYELLGKLCAKSKDAPRPGTPLALWCHGGTLDPHWRHHLEAHPGSLYAALEELRELKSLLPEMATPSNSLDELRELRNALDLVAGSGPNLKSVD